MLKPAVDLAARLWRRGRCQTKQNEGLRRVNQDLFAGSFLEVLVLGELVAGNLFLNLFFHFILVPEFLATFKTLPVETKLCSVFTQFITI